MTSRQARQTVRVFRCIRTIFLPWPAGLGRVPEADGFADLALWAGVAFS